MRSRLYFENVSRPYKRPQQVPLQSAHPPLANEGLYIQYIICYIQVGRGGGGLYRTEHVQHVRRFVCFFLPCDPPN